MAEPDQDRNNSGKSAAEIEREIDRTRAEIDDTLDRIFDRLTPGQAFEQAIDYLRRSNGASVLGTTLKNNPIPAVLATIGIGWLILAGMRERARQSEIDGNRLPARDVSDRAIAGRLAEADAAVEVSDVSSDGDVFEARRTRVFTAPADGESEPAVDTSRDSPAPR